MAQATRRYLAACFAWMQVRLGFFSLALVLVEVQGVGVVHMASSRRSCRSEAKDGRFDGVGCGIAQVRPNYPYFIIVLFLAHRGILVFWFSL
jgi:hypothetical protein